MVTPLEVGDRLIGPGHPVYVIAELSANHNGDFDEAVALVEAAKDAGADAVKLQTYTPETMTIACENEYFQIRGGTLWEGKNLYDLYQEAQTPWSWQPRLKEIAVGLDLQLFSTAFDPSSVAFLEEMDVPLHKIASFELVDIPLIECIASTGKPLILSTGMASLCEIERAVNAARGAGAGPLALLKCTSAYPAPPSEMHLRTIPQLGETFRAVVGLSDHSMATAVPTAAVALGACLVEKHLTLSRANPGPDSAFSLEPAEFAAMVESIRIAEKALGTVSYALGTEESRSHPFRRSLFVVRDMAPGDVFSEENVRSIRPGNGLAPRHLESVLGRRARHELARGTPLSWDDVG